MSQKAKYVPTNGADTCHDTKDNEVHCPDTGQNSAIGRGRVHG